MKRIFLVMVMAIGMIVFMTSCGKVPQAEIDNAQMAIENARAAESDLYAPDQFAMVEDSLKAILENIETRKSKLFKNFKDEKAQLEGIVLLADETRMAAETKKQEIIQEYQGVMETVNALIAENKDLLTKAPKGKEGKLALQAISNDIAAVEESVVNANNLYSAGKYIPALEAIKASNEKAVALNNELKDVIAKYNKAR
ncbi:MAG TPA: hypothetical protein VK994_04880 [Bacteroidales bacterium]|nr:hypothetical protein [Bacteroidales bacterium]